MADSRGEATAAAHVIPALELPNLPREVQVFGIVMTPSVSMRGWIVGTFVAGAAIGWALTSDSAIKIPTGINQTKSNSETADSRRRQAGASFKSGDEFGSRLEKALSHPNGIKRERAISTIADGLDPRQIREAIDVVLKVYSPDRRAVMTALFSRWGEIEPKAALEYAITMKDDWSLTMTVEVTKSWAGYNLAEARESVDKMPASMVQKAAVGGLMEKLSESDPKAAFELALKTQTYSNVIDTAFSNWAESNPEEAALYADKLPPGFQRNAALRAVAASWARSDLQSALRWAEAVPAKNEPNEFSTDSPLPNLLRIWMDADSESALRWLEAFPAGEKKSDAVANLIRNIKADDYALPMAERLIAMAHSGEARDQAWDRYVRSWCDLDLDGALAWTQSQSTNVQEKILPALAQKVAQQEPLRALELVASLGEAPRGKATNSVLAAWANTEPADAAAWLAKQPPEASLHQSVAQAWVAQDLPAATQWVNGLADGPMKDEVILRVVSKFQSRNPQVAVAWVEGISDEAKRVEASRKLAQTWSRNDQTAARSWIESSTLPENVKAELLKPDSK